MKNISLNRVPVNTKLYIYGAGLGGIQLKKHIETKRKDIKIIGFLDSYESGEVEGLKKIWIKDFDDKKAKFDTILIASVFNKDIARILDKLEIDNYYNYLDTVLLGEHSDYLLSIYELPGKCNVSILGNNRLCHNVSKWLSQFRKDIVVIDVFNEAEENDIQGLIKKNHSHFLIISEESYEKYLLKSFNQTKIKIINEAIFSEPSDCEAPVIVYQMGKVGSTTVYKSLLPLFGTESVFHTHNLVSKYIKKDAEMGFETCNYQSVKVLSQLLNLSYQIQNIKNVRIISLFRDIIGREISSFFQLLNVSHSEFIQDNGALEKKNIISYLKNHFLNFQPAVHTTNQWLKNEFQKVLGFSVFDFSFDKERGYSIINHNNTSVLILTLENLDQNFNQIGDFLNCESELKMVKANIRSKQKYSEEYKYIRDNFSLPENICRHIYETSFMSHFYTSSSIDSFIEKWSGAKQS